MSWNWISDAVSVIFGAPLNWFQALFDSIPFSYGLLGAAFLITVTVQIFLIPIRGKSLNLGSDVARSTCKRTDIERIN